MRRNNNLTNEFRKKIADDFIETLQNMEKGGVKLWETPWFTGNKPHNGHTNKPYRGLNSFYLRYIQNKKGFEDPRWFTFNQIKEKGWHLKKGSKGTLVEYWFEGYHIEDEDENTEKDEKKEKVKVKNGYWYPKYYTVFNGEQIEGVDKWTECKNENVNPDGVISEIVQGMGVELFEDQIDKAFYNSTKDQVHLPKREYFKNDNSYNFTSLHELVHATGHKNRLNRQLCNSFGDSEYAFEELIAEIGCCFTSEYLKVNIKDSSREFNNSKEYIKSWIEAIQDKPMKLSEAIKKADEAAEYIKGVL